MSTVKPSVLTLSEKRELGLPTRVAKNSSTSGSVIRVHSTAIFSDHKPETSYLVVDHGERLSILMYIRPEDMRVDNFLWSTPAHVRSVDTNRTERIDAAFELVGYYIVIKSDEDYLIVSRGSVSPDFKRISESYGY